jgi:hypothetical protein
MRSASSKRRRTRPSDNRLDRSTRTGVSEIRQCEATYALRLHPLVRHSLPCLLWFHARGTVAPVERVRLVSPPASDRVPKGGASFLLESIDASAVHASAAHGIAIACSDADPHNPAGAQALYGDSLAVAVTVVAHISRQTLGTVTGHSSSAGAYRVAQARDYEAADVGVVRRQSAF